MKKFRYIILLFISLWLWIDVINCGSHSAQNIQPLIFVTTKDIRLANSTKGSSKPKVQVLVRNLTDGIALDFNYAAKKLCWTDHGLEMIQCVTYNGTDVGNKVEVVSSGLISPDGLACDWFTNKLYWTDGETNRIEVATMDGEYRKVLFWSEIDQPRAIVLVPMRGLMFWTDWGEAPKIERAGMNGDPATRKIIVSDDIFWPNGLTVDYENELIYWLDGKLQFIAVMNYNGTDLKKIVTHGLVYPFAITQFHGKFYFTDWQTCCVYSYDQNTTNVVQPRELLHSESCPMDIHVWEERRQPPPQNGKSYCDEPPNGGCSHLCLLSPTPPYYSCACPIGIKLVDKKNCAPGPQELLITALRTEICVVYLDSLDYTHRTLPLKDVRYSIAVDYDPLEGYVYWTDDETKSVRRAQLFDGTNQQNVIIDDINHPDGLAIDWVARNLYWADTGTDRIEVSRLDGQFRRVLLYEGLAEPRAIALAPDHGWIFWSDWNDRQPKIERAALDGSQRRVIVSGSLGWPNGVTLDLERSRLYWCDAKLDKIETASMDGADRIVLTADRVPHSFGLSLMGDWLYWTDWQRRSIDRVHKITGLRRELITDQMPGIMGLKAVRLSPNMTLNSKNPCAYPSNGGCTHLCFHRPSDYVCACQMGYELTSDQKTCVLPMSFLLLASNATIGRISIENGNNERNNITIPISVGGVSPNLKSASALDFDLIGGRMYWADTKQKAIFRAFINGSDAHKLVEVGLRAPEGIAVDYLAQNLYWTDAITSRIEVCRLDGSSRRALFWHGLQEPRSIVVEPLYGYMYWSEWGNNGRISQASLDGQNTIILTSNLEQPRSLTIDDTTRQLYWIDGGSEVQIQTCYVPNCLEKQTLIANLHDPIGLAAYKRVIYFSERKGNIFSYDLSVRKVVHQFKSKSGASALKIVHSDRKGQRNQCSVSNGGCSHLCLALPQKNESNEATNAYVCACPTHFTLKSNNSCLPPKSFMVYSQRNSVVRFVPDTKDCPEAVMPIHNLKTIKAVTFDPVSKYLYWIEGKTRTIKRAPDDGSQPAIIVVSSGSSSRSSGALINPYDLALDPIGRLLFWTCTIQEAINVTRLENGSTIGIVMQRDGEKPRLLALHPTRRLIFWTDVGNEPQILRSRLDGSHRISIKKIIHNVTSIALDLDSDMVYWAEGNKVYTCNIDGENQHSALSENKGIIGQLTVHSGSLYWLEKSYQQQQLRKFDVSTARHDSVKLIHASGAVTDLISVSEVMTHPCSTNRCSQICVGRNNETGPICACAQGLALSDDGVSCVTIPDCGRDFFTCSGSLGHVASGGSSNDCIPVGWRCDGQSDCQDGSDETNCPACRADQFRCRSGGQCIEKSWVCDRSVQCPDGSDELRCCQPEVEFRCPETDVCIPTLEVCDGYENCANGTDESEFICKNFAKKGYVVNSNKKETHAKGGVYIIVVLGAVSGAIILPIMMYYGYKRCALKSNANVNNGPNCTSEQLNHRNKPSTCVPPDLVHMSMLGYDRCHITGASSSTNGSSSATGVGCYPRETLNPPPSPATTGISRDSGSTRHRPYRHYRSINQPPPPTPCSTDVCDESDCNYGALSMGARGYAPFPPPPTPCRSHCPSESCPPSPSSRSSTYFSPLPPPPSPVPPPPESTAPLLDNYDDSLP